MVMPAGFQELLDKKYSIMRQQADAQSLTAGASANLDRVRAGLMPAESQANIGLTKAQTGLVGSQAKKTDAEASVVKPLADATIFNTRMQGNLFGQQAIGEGQLNFMNKKIAGGAPKAVGLTSYAGFDEQLKSILKEGFGYE